MALGYTFKFPKWAGIRFHDLGNNVPGKIPELLKNPLEAPVLAWHGTCKYGIVYLLSI
jgi:hypothetical protein